MFKETTEGTKGQVGIIMGRELTQTEIKEFMASAGLDLNVLDERGETLESWRQECNLFIRTFVNYLGDRLSVIEHRVDRLEQLVKEGHGY